MTRACPPGAAALALAFAFALPAAALLGCELSTFQSINRGARI